MYFYPVHFRLLLASLWMAAVAFVEAQQPAPDKGQAIIFSSPDGGRGSSNTASLPSQSLPLPDPRNDFQGALSISTFDKPSDVPLPALGQGGQFEGMLERHGDWIFMTPAEIFGVATPEKILQIQERDAAGQPKNLTPMERYEERQQAKNSRTNESYSANDPMPFMDFSGNRNNRTNAVSFESIDGGSKNPQSTIFGHSLNNTLNDGLFAKPNKEAPWSKLTGFPAASPAPNPVQQADMEQFRQLLEPGFSSTTPALSPADTTLSTPLISLPSGAFQPYANPIGNSFAPLDSGIGKPLGLEPLPGVVGQTATPPAATPSWAPQPPPWMSQTPQPFAVPQRKF